MAISTLLYWDFPAGCPVLKISPSNVGGGGGWDSNSGQGAKIPHALGLKNKTEAILQQSQ